VIPTFNNLYVLARCLESWQTVAEGQPVELVVVEDGCQDATAVYLETLATTDWGRAHLRWIHQGDLHELRCTNAGMREARAPLVMAWQDDMLLCARWLVPEIVAAFDRYADLGMLCLSRGLNCHPVDAPLRTWEDLHQPERLESTIGPPPLNWFRLQEVDGVIRPWVVRRACTEAVGLLDEAFVPTEWDETDLCFRIRGQGWLVATHGYERVGAYHHLGSTTIGMLSPQYKERVLRNGRLFHDRWRTAISEGSARPRRRWWRPMSLAGLAWTVTRAARTLARRSAGSLSPAGRSAA
jgi:GT2 family glycosyltransferase